MSDKSIEIVWEVEDGYVSGTRPQNTKIRMDEFENGMTANEIKGLIEEIVQSDFEQRVSWHFESDIDKTVAEVMDRLKAREEGVE